VDAVTERLREDIFEGRYLPGTPLRELALAKVLEVSQATVREALQRLERAGLVTRTPNIGSAVTRLSPKDVRERVRLRAALEVMAAHAAASFMGPDQFAELEQRLAVLETAVASNRYYDAAQADLAFHRYIWQCSGNDTLCRALDLVAVPLFAFISILRSQGLQKLPAVVEAHEPLIAALRAGDAGSIREAFEKGATSSYREFLTDPGPAVVSAFGYLQPTTS
jgi:DNA-binding GntR family transcriptional regulator